MVVLKNIAHFERYVSGLFTNEDNERKIKRALKVEYIQSDCLDQHKGGISRWLLQCRSE